MDDSLLYGLIMAGGSGTRLWPRSRNARPKQFIDLIGSSTMLQEAHTRLLPVIPAQRILVATSRDQVATVLQQQPDLPAVNVLGEPQGRGTAAAIGLAAAACASVSFVLYTTCLDVGYYLWLGSTVILFGGGSGFNRYSRRNKIADSAAGPLPLPDPAALGLLRRASTMARLATDVVAGPLRGNSLSPAKPPCSPSSST